MRLSPQSVARWSARHRFTVIGSPRSEGPDRAEAERAFAPPTSARASRPH